MKDKIELLVIEDNVLYVELLRRFLSDLVDEIHIAKTWKEADPLIPNVDIAWADLIVPPDNVDTSLVRVANVRKLNREIVIFVISGHPDPGLAKRSVEAGADAFVSKNELQSQFQIVAMMIHALSMLESRGIHAEVYLEKARLLLAEKISKEAA